MIPGYVLTNFFVYALVNAFTPGPGNILALNTVTNYGWKKGRPLFWGIFAGYYAVQIICAVFVYGVGAFLPHALQAMKYIGAAYILWLAIHIAISKPEVSEEQGSAAFAKGFLLQVRQCQDLYVRHHGFDRVHHCVQSGIVDSGWS